MVWKPRLLKLNMSYFKRFFGHLKTVLTHKKWVYYYASRFGLAWRGLVHDLSKFSPVEFFESIRYWTGTRSPILAAKEQAGISYAWLHHRGRNKHHWEYWVDELDQGGIPRKIPFDYVVEMVCDWLSACRTYAGNADNVFDREYEWWTSHKDRLIMHEDSKKLIGTILWNLRETETVRKNEKDVLSVVSLFMPHWREEYGV